MRSLKCARNGAVAVLLVTGLLVAAAPSSYAVTTVGSCGSLKGLGLAKSTVIGSGITAQDNNDVSIAIKGIDPSVNKGTNLGSCTFASGLSTPDSAKVKGYSGTKSILRWSAKLFSPEFDCNRGDTGDSTEWPPSGMLSMTFTDFNGLGKQNAVSGPIVVDGRVGPYAPASPNDVVAFHGVVSKGVGAGADINGSLYFAPVAKNKLQTTNNPHFGYSLDQVNVLRCVTGDSAANVQAFTVGDGQSKFLDAPASGISFSYGS